MKLSTLLRQMGPERIIRVVSNDKRTTPSDITVTSVENHAQNVKEGSLFVAVKGFTRDGHDFIKNAEASGAIATICESSTQAKGFHIVVDNSRKALAEAAAAFYNHPSKALSLIGITGTNGKTTVSFLIENIIKQAGFKPGVIGTVNYRYGGKAYDNPVTTPESLDLQKILSKMKAEGVTHVIMEVSSHALDLHRVKGCHFDVGVFTNFTQDHLDYHNDMETYFRCKKRLFTHHITEDSDTPFYKAVINCDDEKGKALFDTISYGKIGTRQKNERETPPDFVSPKSVTSDLSGIKGVLKTPKGEMTIESALVGEHNLENILNATAVGIALKLPNKAIETGINTLTRVPGRLESVQNKCHRFIYVDYAHTPDALENVLKTLRSLCRKRLICVFGCGGDRDSSKRPKMGMVAMRYSDLSVVTSDNPRSEDPSTIIDDILEGVRGVSKKEYQPSQLNLSSEEKGFVVIADRADAIKRSIHASNEEDTILIAGKGHETYQILKDRTIDFDDRIQVKVALETLKDARTSISPKLNH